MEKIAVEDVVKLYKLGWTVEELSRVLKISICEVFLILEMHSDAEIEPRLEKDRDEYLGRKRAHNNFCVKRKIS